MKAYIAGLLLLVLITGCALTELLLPSGAPSVPPMTPTYTPYPPTSGVPTFTPIPLFTPTNMVVTPAPTGNPSLTPYPEITYVPTMIATLIPVTGVYLPFERGFMVYVEGADCLYAYADGIIIPAEYRARFTAGGGNYAYCVTFTDLPDAPFNTPETPFGRVWQRYDEVKRSLGDPIGGVYRYETTIPPSEPVVMGGVFYSGMVTLPDGRQLYCGTRGATAGRCELRG